MVRFSITLCLFILLSLAANAQSRSVNVEATPEMVASADMRVAELDRAVQLTTEQRTQLQDIFLGELRVREASRQRLSGHSPEDFASEMAVLETSISERTERFIHNILTEEQLVKYHSSR